MLIIKNARLSFNRETLFDHFNLHLSAGQIACICGTSGKGKTSLLNAIQGFTPLDSGSITVGGIELSDQTIDKIRHQIAWIPQELALPCEWVKEMVALPFGLKGNRSTSFSITNLMEAFTALGLDHELYDKRVGEVSGGQRQRIMIATEALLNKPLLIIDEPTSALDSHSSQRVLHFLQQWVTQRGTTVLTVSHDKTFAEGCDQIIHL